MHFRLYRIRDGLRRDASDDDVRTHSPRTMLVDRGCIVGQRGVLAFSKLSEAGTVLARDGVRRSNLLQRLARGGSEAVLLSPRG